MRRNADIGTRYCEEILINTLIFSIGTIGVIIFSVLHDDIINKERYGLAIFIALMCVFAICLLCSILGLIPIVRDYKAYTKKQYCEVCGKVIGFKWNLGTADGIQHNTIPIIVTANGKKIVLKVGKELEVGKTYRFYYLRYTKIAEIIVMGDMLY